MSQVSASELRKNMLVDVGGKTCSIVHWNIWKSDRRSKIQMKFKEILTGRTSEVTAQPDDRGPARSGAARPRPARTW
jgi:translation elongation factor P/translation initiation factor 5A